MKSLATIQENFHSAAEEIAHTPPKKDRDSHKRRLPPKVKMGEAAAARSSKSTETKVQRRQARKGRAEHLVKCTLVPGRKGTGRKTLNELLVNGEFSENSEDWKELQRHCESVHVDLEEKNKKQKERIQRDENWVMNNSRKEKRRSPRVKSMARGTQFVSEMMKRLPLANVYEVAKFSQGRFMGRVEAPYSRKIVQPVFLRKPDAEPKKAINSFRAIALTAGMSN